MFVLDSDGTKIGTMDKRTAIEKAKSKGFDLVVISSNFKQPVAKILDYGKFKYQRKKKRKEAKVKNTTISNKEVRLTPMIGTHDLMVKSRKTRELIMAGDRVKVSLRFKGREMARKELGYAKLDEFFKTISDIAKMDKPPTLNGPRYLDIYVSRDKKKKPKENENAKDEN
ncbi:MAG: translation initiation factor IF-3 [Mycoplasmatales bacterium]|nr:translation initiation factor IF-3 [Mycoplasmatales bacterium]